MTAPFAFAGADYQPSERYDPHAHLSRFDSHIEIGGSPSRWTYRGQSWALDRYQRAVRDVLDRIAMSRTGRLVLGAIARPVLIVPWQDDRTTGAQVSAVRSIRMLSFVPTGSPAAHRRAVRSGHWAEPNDPRNPGVPDRRMGVGTGQGSCAKLEYTPAMWLPGTPFTANGVTTDTRREVLLHEMFHAMRYTRGLIDRRPLAGTLARYTDRSEFFAIAVTNVFRSEMGITPLRGSHVLFNGRPLPLANPAGFYDVPEQKLLIWDLCRDMPSLTRDLAGVAAAFNPFRAYYTEMRMM